MVSFTTAALELLTYDPWKDIAPILRRTPGRAPDKRGKSEPQQPEGRPGSIGGDDDDAESSLPDEPVHLGAPGSVDKPAAAPQHPAGEPLRFDSDVAEPESKPEHPAGEPLRLDPGPTKPEPKPEHPAGEPLRFDGDRKDDNKKDSNALEATKKLDKDVNLDEHPFLVGESKDYAQLQQKGLRVDGELHTAVRTRQPDKVSLGRLQDLYDE